MHAVVGSTVAYRPADWPSPGPIDLAIHDLPHDSSTLEWWYVNAHLAATDGREFSLFAAFFRVRRQDEREADRRHAHFLTWGVTDVRAGRFNAHTLLDPRTPGLAIRDIDAKTDHGDARLTRALREVLAKGVVPLPDRLMRHPARVERASLDLDFDGNRFHKHRDGSYQLSIMDDRRREGARLRFTLEKPVVRHGDDGVVRGVEGEDMFYYFSPRCRVDGQLLIDGEWLDVASGAGWYDHEFGRPAESSPAESGEASDTNVAWNWVSAQLDNGYDVTAYDLFDSADPTISCGRWVIVVDPNGERIDYSDFSFEGLDYWTSTRTFNEYPTRYRLDVPGANLTLDISATLANQEIITLLSPPAFWEGRVTVRGTMNGVDVTGRGFVERSGLTVVRTTDDFFASVGRETRRAIDALLPEHVGETQALALMGGHTQAHVIRDVDLEQYRADRCRPDPRDHPARRQGVALLRGTRVHRSRRWRVAAVRALARPARAAARRLAHHRRLGGRLGRTPRRTGGAQTVRQRAGDQRRLRCVLPRADPDSTRRHRRRDIGSHLRSVLRRAARRACRTGARHRRPCADAARRRR